MCSLPDPKKTKKPPVSRGRANFPNWQVMQWLDEERARRGLSDREIGRRLGYHNGTRVRKYFNQQIVPGPEMVRRLAIAVGVSPIAALWIAEHYAAVFGYLQKLYGLGWSWMKADKVDFGDTFGTDFSSYYINRFGKIPDNVMLNEAPTELADRYHHATIYYNAGVLKRVSLAKPIACAILLAVAVFPRRGEKLRPEATSLFEQLSVVASEMITAAEMRAAQVPPGVRKSLRRPLREAEKILPWRFYGSMRLAVVGEYVHAWCDFANVAYANYARLALYQEGAFVGEPGEHEDMWQELRADLPNIDDLRVATTNNT